MLKSILNPDDSEFHLGSGGNVTAVWFKDVTPTNVLVVGPPCPPWAGQGNAKSSEDPRAQVFETMMAWAVHMIQSKVCAIVVFENVVGIKRQLGGREPYIDVCIEALRDKCPGFHWDYITLGLVSYGVPHIRDRVFLRGMDKEFASAIPSPVPPPNSLPKLDLRAWLDPSLPHTDRSSLHPTKRQNLRDVERMVKVMLKTGNEELQYFPLIVASIDRATDKEGPLHIVVNKVPTLSVTNEWLFVMSTADIDQPDHQREYFRFIHVLERLPLAGFSKALSEQMDSGLVLKATGNAYSPVLLAAVLGPMLDVLAKGKWEPPTTTNVNVSLDAFEFKLQGLRSRRKAKAAKHKAKAAKRVPKPKAKPKARPKAKAAKTKPKRIVMKTNAKF